MYTPAAFREDRPEVLRALIRAHPLATLVTAGASGLIANALPFTLTSCQDGDVLHAHLAKANEQVADLRKGATALAIFQGPQAYVSPSWYATKREHGRVVPTWNYVVVQCRGTPSVIDDVTWIRAQLDALTADHERGRAAPWEADDAPADFVAGRIKGIVGLRLPVGQMDGKWKVSQNQPKRNRSGVADGLRSEGHTDLATEVALRF